jgi:hypothetical protein
MAKASGALVWFMRVIAARVPLPSGNTAFAIRFASPAALARSSASFDAM